MNLQNEIKKVIQFSPIWRSIPIHCGLPYRVTKVLCSKKLPNDLYTSISSDQTLFHSSLEVRARVAYYDVKKSCSVLSNTYRVKTIDIIRDLGMNSNSQYQAVIAEVALRCLLAGLTAARKSLHFPMVYDIFTDNRSQHILIDEMKDNLYNIKSQLSLPQIYSILFQALAAQAFAFATTGKFFKLDFHNIGLVPCSSDLILYYQRKNVLYKVPTNGWLVKLLSIKERTPRKIRWPHFVRFRVSTIPEDAWVFDIGE